jgi:hypothetical protein
MKKVRKVFGNLIAIQIFQLPEKGGSELYGAILWLFYAVVPSVLNTLMQSII